MINAIFSATIFIKEVFIWCLLSYCYKIVPVFVLFWQLLITLKFFLKRIHIDHQCNKVIVWCYLFADYYYY